MVVPVADVDRARTFNAESAGLISTSTTAPATTSCGAADTVGLGVLDRHHEELCRGGLFAGPAPGRLRYPHGVCELVARGVEVSEIYIPSRAVRCRGRIPNAATTALFLFVVNDPNDNGWAVQEVTWTEPEA